MSNINDQRTVTFATNVTQETFNIDDAPQDITQFIDPIETIILRGIHEPMNPVFPETQRQGNGMLELSPVINFRYVKEEGDQLARLVFEHRASPYHTIRRNTPSVPTSPIVVGQEVEILSFGHTGNERNMGRSARLDAKRYRVFFTPDLRTGSTPSTPSTPSTLTTLSSEDEPQLTPLASSGFVGEEGANPSTFMAIIPRPGQPFSQSSENQEFSEVEVPVAEVQKDGITKDSVTEDDITKDGASEVTPLPAEQDETLVVYPSPRVSKLLKDKFLGRSEPKKPSLSPSSSNEHSKLSESRQPTRELIVAKISSKLQGMKYAYSLRGKT